MVSRTTDGGSFAELLNHRLHGYHDLVKSLDAAFLEGENPKAGILCHLINLERYSNDAVLLLLLLCLIGCLRNWVQSGSCWLRSTVWSSW